MRLNFIAITSETNDGRTTQKSPGAGTRRNTPQALRSRRQMASWLTDSAGLLFVRKEHLDGLGGVQVDQLVSLRGLR